MEMNRIGLTILVLFLLLQGCNSPESNTSQPESNSVQVGPSNLNTIAGIEWRLTQMVVNNDGVPLLPDATVTFLYTGDGKVAGSASINRYFGNLEMSKDGNITWSEPGFGTTLMAGPPELMSQETKFLKSLKSVQQMYLKDSTLTMESDDRSVYLVFVKDT